MVRRFFIVLASLVMLLSVVSCSAPSDTEIFVRTDEANNGVYVFDFPMADTLSRYDISFYSRSEKRDLRGVELTVLWLAPSGDSANETVYMGDITRKGSAELYRTGVSPAESGNWRISVRPKVEPGEIAGFGMICKKRDGTR